MATALVPRPRLFRRLDRSRGRVVWVLGSPGAGKTALVASWLAQRKRPALWMHLDEGDSDVATFFHYLRLAANGRKGKAPTFEREHLVSPALFARRFFRALYAAPNPPVLVLDDYHAIRADSPVHAALGEGLEEIPKGAEVVITSRASPPPGLARLQVGGVLEVLAGEELALDSREAVALSRRWGYGPRDRSAVLELHARCAGWVAGMVLLLARRGRDEAARGWEDAMFGYFAEEVLQRSAPAVRKVLLETAFLARVPSALAAELSGVEQTGEILADLARRGYFVARHGGTEPTYEFHALFRAFLRRRAEEELPPERQRLVRVVAARRLAQAEDPTEAFDLFLAAGAWDEAAKLIISRAPQLIDQGRSETVSRVIQGLPEERWGRDPWLLLWLAMAGLIREPSRAREHAERALELFEATGDATGTYGALALIGTTRQAEADDLAPLDGWLRKLAEVRHRYEDVPYTKPRSFVVSAALRVLYARQPGNPWTRQWEERALELALGSEDAQTRWEMAVTLLVGSARWARDLPRARMLTGMFRPQHAVGPVWPPRSFWWHFGCASMYLHQGASAAARKEAEQGLAVSAEKGFHDWDPHLLVLRAFAELLAGDVDAARAAIGQATEPMHRSHRGIRSMLLHAASVVARRAGDVALAQEHARRAVELARGAGMPLEEATGLLALAVAESPGTAARRLEQACELGRRCGCRLVEAAAQLGLAVGALRRDDEAAALEGVREGLRIACELGVGHVLWLLPEELADVCGLALQHGVEPEYAAALIRTLQLAPGEGARELDAWPWPVRTEALRGFTVQREEALLVAGRKTQKKPLEMLRCLVAQGAGGAAQETLAEALWPDADVDAAMRALNTTLYRLRKLLGSTEAVLQREGRIALNPRLVYVDLWALRRLLDRTEAAQRRRAPLGQLDALRARLERFVRNERVDEADPLLGELRARLEQRIERCLTAAVAAEREQPARARG
ncbi:MAG TPA: hypothetical protein VEB43_16910 [Anaeromyxobacter sp.]|nr:hypothetical protein [Anaeromyxobacter sp.]